MQEVHKLLKDGDSRKYHDFSNWAVTRLGLRPTKDIGDGGLDSVGQVTLWNPQMSLVLYSDILTFGGVGGEGASVIVSNLRAELG